MTNKAFKRTFIAVLSNNMDISKNIKRIREAKELSQKEVISAIGMGAAQYSRIENGKTDPSVSTLIKIAKALGVSMAELFTDKDSLQDINSVDTTLMERVTLIDSLTKEEQNTIFSILDAFVSKRKLKSTLKNVLQDMD
ncbi:helix-turn-helix domain-containing protein [Aquimarina sediminis]|uniref:helix-turn-helix domain-containing protein n=1 Tax=Aquimarina sediminis TaxID=2070536 RepID=UPI000FFE3A21|nr:helix-turn-helix transcriptional regulator [Aquimarina sediminis]